MIIRTHPTPTDPQRVLLISQQQHARLAGTLARHWQAPASMPFDPMLLDTIDQHDDGWAAWDAAPQIDPATALPYSFDQMPLSESLAIWTQSVQHCRAIGPLAAYVVAGHFCHLLRVSSDADQPAAMKWVDDFEDKSGDWLNRWLAADPQRHTVHGAKTQILWLQLFDLLSLTLCLTPPGRPQTLTDPTGENYRLITHPNGQADLHPWPLSETSLSLTVTGKVCSPVDVSAEPALDLTRLDTQPLTWHLQQTHSSPDL